MKGFTLTLKIFLPILAGWIAFYLLSASELSFAGRVTAGVAVLMALYWLFETIHISATALLPLALLPLFGGTSIEQAASPYAHKLIFLFMGGFFLGVSMQKWNLHRRIALTTLRIFGTRPRNLIFGFMVSTAVMSMWVSNTAVVVMIFPIAMSVLSLLPEKNRPFTVCLMLAVAYSASIGGIGTLIGTPPNALFAAYIEKEMSLQLDFSRWFVIGLPVVVIFLPLTWWLLTRVLFSISSEASIETKQHLDDEFEKLGPLTPPEMRVAILFFTTAFLWIFRPWIQELLPTQWGTLDDAGIAMIASCALFTLPAGGNQKTERLLDWASAKTIPWDVLILFGGGLSLASALTKNGVAEALGSQFSLLAGAPTIVLIFMVAISITFLTEITSNTAIVATFLPILFSISEHLGVNPHLLLIPATLAASCAFMMPIATPPNAIVFSSGDLQIKDMARAGFLLNMAGTVIITLLTYFVYRPIVESW